MRLNLFGVVLVAFATLAANTNAATKVKCSVESAHSTCAKNQYCLAAKPHSYCTAKLDGGKQCSKDQACKSGICFIAKTRHEKRVCASLPLSGYPLKAQCTESKQCKSHFCDNGHCEKPVAAGEKCPKEVGCAELDKGAHCLRKPATFVVYDSAGKKQTKKLDAGRCSYVRNLGQGMKCSSDANCFKDKFTCSEDTKECTRIVKPPSNLPYQETCSDGSQCASGKCINGKCGCDANGSDCDATTQYCGSPATCRPKLAYGQSCALSNQCQENICVTRDAQPVRREFASKIVRDQPQICGCSSDASCNASSEFCDLQSNLCTPKKTYTSTCSSSNECMSDRCSQDGHCGCSIDGSDCSATEFCSTDVSATCQTKKSLHSSCTSPEQCLSSVCRPGFDSNVCGCSADNQCEASGAWCNTTVNLCMIKLSHWDTCERDEQCTSGKCANGQCGCTIGGTDCNAASEFCDDTQTCRSRFAAGHSCSGDGQCLSGTCKDQVCACYSNADCALPTICLSGVCQISGFCNYYGMGGLTCPSTVCIRIPGSTGGPDDRPNNCQCSVDADCGPGTVCAGQYNSNHYCRP